MKLFQHYKYSKYLILLCIIPMFFIFLFIPKTEAAELSTGYYAISTKDLTLRLNTDTAKSNAVLKGSNNLSGQKFYLQKLSDGYYKIGTGVTGSASVLESDLSQKRWSKANSQKWTITSSGDYYTIKNKATGKFLSFSGKTLKANATALLTESLWKFTPYREKYTVTFKDGYTEENLLKNTNNISANTLNNSWHSDGGWAIVTGGTGVGSISTITDSKVSGIKTSFKITGNTDTGRDWAQRALPLDYTQTNGLSLDGKCYYATSTDLKNWTYQGTLKAIDDNGNYCPLRHGSINIIKDKTAKNIIQKAYNK